MNECAANQTRAASVHLMINTISFLRNVAAPQFARRSITYS